MEPRRAWTRMSHVGNESDLFIPSCYGDRTKKAIQLAFSLNAQATVIQNTSGQAEEPPSEQLNLIKKIIGNEEDRN
jgi:hypothetical protein